MLRFLIKFLIVIFLAILSAGGIILYLSSDPVYVIQEWLNYSRFRRFDLTINEVARKHQVDPLLIKAIIWRESSFHPEMAGTRKERGLMQITEGAADDWIKANKIENFDATDLFDPKTNIEIGTWYLSQALQRWKDKEDPIPFALAEYNAGRGRVDRWMKETNLGKEATADDLRTSISFPGTLKYIETIMARYHFYKKRQERKFK